MLFDAPTKEEYRIILNEYPFDESVISGEAFQYTTHPVGSVESFHANDQILHWRIHLQNRTYQTRWSWVYLTHSFKKGIPDDEWFISPGRKGESVKYFPHFEETHFKIKAQFNYFSDIFYYKLFSAWDTLGHILNHMYDLDIKRPDFHKSVKQLKDVRPDLYSKLDDLMESGDFREMKVFRHSTTHNELIGFPSASVTKVSEDHLTFGVGRYFTSSRIKNNIDRSLIAFSESIRFIKEQIAIDTA